MKCNQHLMFKLKGGSCYPQNCNIKDEMMKQSSLSLFPCLISLQPSFNSYPLPFPFPVTKTTWSAKPNHISTYLFMQFPSVLSIQSQSQSTKSLHNLESHKPKRNDLLNIPPFLVDLILTLIWLPSSLLSFHFNESGIKTTKFMTSLFSLSLYLCFVRLSLMCRKERYKMNERQEQEGGEEQERRTLFHAFPVLS